MKSRKEIKKIARENMGRARGFSICLFLLLYGLAIVGWILWLIPGLATFSPFLWRIPNLTMVRLILRGNPVVGVTITIVTLLLFLVPAVGLRVGFVSIYNREPTGIGKAMAAYMLNPLRKLGGMLWMALFTLLWLLPTLFVNAIAIYIITMLGFFMIMGMPPTTVVSDGAVFFAFLFYAGLIAIVVAIISIPVVWKFISYSMTPYILAEHPDVKAMDALRLSKRMTKGWKKELFVMYLSFFGWFAWFILGNLTLTGLYSFFVSLIVYLNYLRWFNLSFFALGILIIAHAGPYMETTMAGYFVELRKQALADKVIHPEELGMMEVNEQYENKTGQGI